MLEFFGFSTKPPESTPPSREVDIVVIPTDIPSEAVQATPVSPNPEESEEADDEAEALREQLLKSLAKKKQKEAPLPGESLVNLMVIFLQNSNKFV